MAKRNQHVIPLGNGWAVKGEGNTKFTEITKKKPEATGVAPQIAKNNQSSIVIDGENGKIQDMKSYHTQATEPKSKAK